MAKDVKTSRNMDNGRQPAMLALYKAVGRHYKPNDTNMLAVLQTFKMLGVSIRDIVVENFHGKGAVKAPLFDLLNANWDKLMQHRDENLDLRKDLFPDKQAVLNPRNLGVGVVNSGYNQEDED